MRLFIKLCRTRSAKGQGCPLACYCALRSCLYAAVLLLAGPAVHADRLGFTIGGDVLALPTSTATKKGLLDNTTLFARFEHPLPLFPNVEIRRSHSATQQFDNNRTDLTGYYQIFDNDWINLDVGLGAGRMQWTTDATHQNRDKTYGFFMVEASFALIERVTPYLQVHRGATLSRLFNFGEQAPDQIAQGIKDRMGTFSDVEVGLYIDLFAGLSLTVGYSRLCIRKKQQTDNGLQVLGIKAGVQYHL